MQIVLVWMIVASLVMNLALLSAYLYAERQRKEILASQSCLGDLLNRYTPFDERTRAKLGLTPVRATVLLIEDANQENQCGNACCAEVGSTVSISNPGSSKTETSWT